MSYEGKGVESDSRRVWDGEKWIEVTSSRRLSDVSFDPIGLWHFNGDLTDASGNGKTLTPNTTAVFNTGPFPGVASFDTLGVNNTAERSDTDFAILTAISVQAVCFFNAIPASDEGVVAYNETGTGGDTEAQNCLWSIGFDNTGGIRYFHENGAGDNNELLTTIYPPTQEWCHLAFTRASNGTDIKLFLNGSKILDSSVSNAPTGGSSSRLVIGSLFDFDQNQYAGMISSVKICASELSEASILAEALKVIG